MLKVGRRTFLSGSILSSLATLTSRAWAGVIGYPRAVQGPMIGAPGPNSFSVWVRASGEFPVHLEYSTDRSFREFSATDSVVASADDNLCVVLTAEDLEPNTKYWYRLRFAGEPDKFQPFAHWTKTAPAGNAKFRVGFGSCCRIQLDPVQRIWNVARVLEPDMFIWLGDNIYADSDQAQILVDLYARGRVVERIEPFLRSTPQLATWDDHDFGYNDSDSLSPYRDVSLKVFKDFWANPAYGEEGNPGVYFKQSYGGVDFFVLDGRYHRDPTDRPDNASKTMLGARQKAWLKEQLLASDAAFKVLAVGGGWSCAENEDGGDSWAVYMTERNELFDFIRDNDISGVVCISGDSHMGELNCIPWSEKGGYDFYDFCSSPLAQQPANKKTRQTPEVRIRDTWTRTVNIGLLEFDMTGEQPMLTYNLYDNLGEPVWDPLVLTPDDLKNGVSTWRDKADPVELDRLERFKAGKGYYGYDPAEGWPDTPYYGRE